MGKYPSANELGTWSGTLTEVQSAVVNKIWAADMSDWPPRFFDLVGEIVTDWAGGISGDVFFEAICCAVHHEVHGTQCPQDLADFMADREERIGLCQRKRRGKPMTWPLSKTTYSVTSTVSVRQHATGSTRPTRLIIEPN
jgi:hypothetical protein